MARLAAEHFWPAWPKAERTRSATAASRSAVAVMTMAFLPLVSACRRRVGSQDRNSCAVSQAPVRIDGVDVGMGDEAPADLVLRARAGRRGGPRGRRPRRQQSTRSRPTATVCGAGFRMTPDPAASAASTPPAGMASGKFQGDATTVTPWGSNAQAVALERRRPAAAAGVPAGEVDGLGHLGVGLGDGLARVVRHGRDGLAPTGGQHLGDPVQHATPLRLRSRPARPRRRGAPRPPCGRPRRRRPAPRRRRPGGRPGRCEVLRHPAPVGGDGKSVSGSLAKGPSGSNRRCSGGPVLVPAGAVDHGRGARRRPRSKRARWSVPRRVSPARGRTGRAGSSPAPRSRRGGGRGRRWRPRSRRGPRPARRAGAGRPVRGPPRPGRGPCPRASRSRPGPWRPRSSASDQRPGRRRRGCGWRRRRGRRRRGGARTRSSRRL